MKSEIHHYEGATSKRFCKTITTLLLLLSLFFSVAGRAQQPGDSKPLASNNSWKGKKELRKEKNVLKRDRKLTVKNERHAVNRQKDSYSIKFGVKHKKKKNKKSKEKDRSATSGEKPKE